MAGTRSLPDLVSRITIDTRGLTAAEAQAKISAASMGSSLGAAGKGAKSAEQDVAALEKRMGAAGISTGKWTTLLGGGAGLNPALLGAGVAAFGLVTAGKSIIDISDKWEASQKNLAQATASIGGYYAGARQEVDAFIKTNARFISSQSEVVDAYAALLRQGLGTAKAQDDLNLALDLSVVGHKSLTEAVTLLQKAEMGQGRALVPLGIQIKEFPVLQETATKAAQKLEAAEKAVEKATTAHTAAIKAHGPHSTQAQASAKVLAEANVKLAEAHNYAADRAKASAEVHDLLHKRLDGGRKSVSDLQAAQNQLGNTWQDLAQKAGPPLLKVLEFMVEQFAGLVGWIEDVIAKIGDLIGWIGKIDVSKIPLIGGTFAAHSGGIPAGSHHARASGGPVLPNSIYTVGERGPETLVMGSQGGTVIPNSGGGTLNNRTLRQLLVETQVGNNLLRTIARKPGLAGAL